MNTTLILSVHVVVAFSIVGLVLIQHGKGADAGAAFGGGGGGAGGASGSVFGAQGSSNFLSSTTAILAAIFFGTSLTMAYLTTSGHEEPTSLMDEGVNTTIEVPSITPTIPADVVPSDVPGVAPRVLDVAPAAATVDKAPNQAPSDVPK